MELDFLSQTILFRGMSQEEIMLNLTQMKAYEKTYEKNEFVLCAGATTRVMGLIVSGSVTIESNDVWGNCTVLSHVGKGGVFAETYAMIPDEILLVDVRTNEPTRVLFLDLLNSTEKLKKNLLNISIKKNLMLSRRSFHISPKTIRGKLLSYLNTMSLQKGSQEFDIPFDRQQLADYLNVDRTALSKELGHMKSEGLIDFKKSHFILYDMSL